MARSFADTARMGGAISIPSYPFSMGVWYRHLTAANQNMAGLCGSGISTSRYAFLARAAGQLRLVTSSSLGSTNTTTTNAGVPGEWNYALGIFTSSQDRRVVLNGDFAGSATSSSDRDATLDSLVLGTSHIDGGFTLFDGNLAEFTVWDGHEITEAQALGLAGGSPALSTQRDAIKHNLRLLRTEDTDRVTNLKVIELGVGTLGVAPHPPIRYTNRPRYVSGIALTPPPVVNGLLTNLISYWKLEEAGGNPRADSHGSNDLTEVNNPVAQVVGHIGNGAGIGLATTSYLRDGTNDGSLAIAGDKSGAFWIKLNSLTGAIEVGPNKYGGGTNREWRIRILTDGTLRVDIIGGGSPVVDTVIHGPLTLDVWTHIVWRHDVTGGFLRLAVNGVHETPTVTTGNSQAGTTTYALGVNATDIDLDELSHWDRALTDDDVAALYNAGAGLSYDSFD